MTKPKVPPSWLKGSQRGQTTSGRWAGATKHAVQQLYERASLNLTGSQWAAIVNAACEGHYEETKAYRAPPSGAVQTYRVPMGTSEADMIWVPMVINIDDRVVITVLQPEIV